MPRHHGICMFKSGCVAQCFGGEGRSATAGSFPLSKPFCHLGRALRIRPFQRIAPSRPFQRIAPSSLCLCLLLLAVLSLLLRASLRKSNSGVCVVRLHFCSRASLLALHPLTLFMPPNPSILHGAGASGETRRGRRRSEAPLRSAPHNISRAYAYTQHTNTRVRTPRARICTPLVQVREFVLFAMASCLESYQGVSGEMERLLSVGWEGDRLRGPLGLGAACCVGGGGEGGRQGIGTARMREAITDGFRGSINAMKVYVYVCVCVLPVFPHTHTPARLPGQPLCRPLPSIHLSA